MKVKCSVKIISKKILSEIPNAWSNQDFINILDSLGFSDEVKEEELKEMAMMAISDNSPEESAELLLQYRLGEKLNEGQIQQLSHEMQEDKVSEEYPDISLQKDFFDINQLLFKSYNGKFPNCHVVDFKFNLTLQPETFLKDKKWTNEVILKSLIFAMGGNSIFERLFGDEMNGLKKFNDADGIIWNHDIQKLDDGSFNIQIFSSEYWLEDLPTSGEYDTTFKLVEVEEEEV